MKLTKMTLLSKQDLQDLSEAFEQSAKMINSLKDSLGIADDQAVQIPLRDLLATYDNVKLLINECLELRQQLGLDDTIIC